MSPPQGVPGPLPVMSDMLLKDLGREGRGASTERSGHSAPPPAPVPVLPQSLATPKHMQARLLKSQGKKLIF